MKEIYIKINDDFIIKIPRDLRMEFLDDRYQERVNFIKSCINSDTKLEDINRIIVKSNIYMNCKYLGCRYSFFEFKDLDLEE